jgi:hypothetical protein
VGCRDLILAYRVTVIMAEKENGMQDVEESSSEWIRGEANTEDETG